MDTLFRILCRHLRTLWLRARSFFLSIRSRRLHSGTSNDQSTTATTRTHRPPTPMPAPSTAGHIPALSTARAKARRWARTRARKLKTQMIERHVDRKATIMQIVYARVAAAGTAGKEKDRANVTSKCRAEDEDDEASDEDTEGTMGQADDGLDAFEGLFRSLSSSPALRFDTLMSSHPPFSQSLSVPSTPGLLTPALPETDLPPELDPGNGLSSPMISCASSGSCDGSAPTTPTTPFGFPGTRIVDEPTSVTSRLHLRPHPRPRAQFRTLSASIIARSPLSFSFPLSLSLPLAARRASSPGTVTHRFMDDHGEHDRDSGDGRSRTQRVDDGVFGEDGDGVKEGEDPFGANGSVYYGPAARVALGLGDAYDLSAWAWACDHSPYRRTKRKYHDQEHCNVQAAPATKVIDTTAVIDSGSSGDGTNIASDTRSRFVYRAPIYATSAPQLSGVQCQDEESVGYLRALANATARGRRVSKPLCACLHKCARPCLWG
ncbi:hypothetical protein F5148DRAFT_418461 [Russula earlei]|uniref:Uncharacterized protein n=1 Tax=Russula earlei TaxID=71964 RepID=A0ACC0U0B6_9AGAM|nr:hypothetical protein F5148DRAFT_418461 [Russula earlei]